MYTHCIMLLGLIVPRKSCVVVLGTFAVWTQAKRIRGIVDYHVTKLACTITKSIVWPCASTPAVGMTWLTHVLSIGISRLRALRHAVRAVLEVVAMVTFICTLHSHRQIQTNVQTCRENYQYRMGQKYLHCTWLLSYPQSLQAVSNYFNQLCSSTWRLQLQQ